MYNKENKKIGSRALSLFLCTLLSLCMLLTALAFPAYAEQGKYEGMKLIPGGIPFGVKFNTQGVVVIGFCDVDGGKGAVNPAKDAGLHLKDIITKANGNELRDANDLTGIIEKSEGKEIKITYLRGSEEKNTVIKPSYSKSEARYKAGIWIRDSGAGIGTVTYIYPDTYAFGGLGHGICDGDTGELIPMSRGVVTDVTVSGVKKGVSGTPGEIKGYFGASKRGTLFSNTDCGVYGMFSECPLNVSEAIAVGGRNEIKEGEAYIMCTLSDGKPVKYKIEIAGINRDAKGSKCFTVFVKDPALIEKTGGIVQGMSGSPIIQNEKLVGAVTHVCVNL